MYSGIIISNISNTYLVEESSSNKIIKCNARGKFREKEITPIVGDNVKFEIIDPENKEGIINEILNRNTYLKRPKLANITQIAFIISMKMPKPDLLMLDKQLAFSEFNNIKPIICFNKIDLENEKFINQIEKLYAEIGYDVIKTNAKSGLGINELKQKLKNNITAFAGNSGVGKSTLTNSILKAQITQEGVISKRNKRGKNTTTSTYLYKIDDNTYIADTPGFSTFDINEIGSENLFKYFKELEKFACNCEFVGCTHIKEEQCGIKKGVKEGKISKDRYDRFCKIYFELKNKEARRW